MEQVFDHTLMQLQVLIPHMASQKEEEFRITAALHGAKIPKKKEVITDADLDKSVKRAGIKIEET